MILKILNKESIKDIVENENIGEIKKKKKKKNPNIEKQSTKVLIRFQENKIFDKINIWLIFNS